MLGVNIVLPFLAMIVGGLLGTQVYGPNGLVTGAAIGFGVGCAIVVLVWVLFAVLKKWVE